MLCTHHFIWYTVRLGDLEVFDLIRKRRLHTALLENLQFLMKLGPEVGGNVSVVTVTVVAVATTKDCGIVGGV